MLEYFFLTLKNEMKEGYQKCCLQTVEVVDNIC